ncbi:MAG: SUMF1/EgtB/PvdO family nonheme iron enzyme [Hyphomicrobiaceae bacterium]
MSSRTASHWLVRLGLTLLVFTGLVGAFAVGLWGLAWMAIHDTPQPLAFAPSRSDRSATGATVETGYGAAALLSVPGNPSVALHGHSASVVAARFSQDGRSLVSFDAAGNVRRADVAASSALHSITEFNGLPWLGDRLWKSYGRTIGLLALANYARSYPMTFRDCASCPEMVVIPAGRFKMGSPEGEEGRSEDKGPQHEVVIGKPFAVGRFEVTRVEYATFVAATGRADAPSCFTETVIGKAD